MKKEMHKKLNKKGFELVWSTIVIIILALVLLIAIIFFFTRTSGSFIDNIKSYFSYSNVDIAVQGCNVLSSSWNDYSFCCEKKTIKYYESGEKKQGEFSCGELSNQSFVNNQINFIDCKEKC